MRTPCNVSVGGGLLALVMVPQVLALDLSWQPRLEGGMMYYGFEQKPTSNTPFNTIDLRRDESFNSFSVSDNLPYLSGGVTMFADRFFVDLSALRAFNGSDTSTQLIRRTDTFSVDGVTNTFMDDYEIVHGVDFDRSEYGVSVGYQVSQGFVVFTGYKWAETEFEFERSGDFRTRLIATDGFDASLSADFTDSLDYDFEQKGPFVGAAYAWNIDSMGANVSANLAVAFLNADTKVRQPDAANFTNGVLTDNSTGESFPVPDDFLANFGVLRPPASNFTGADGDTIGVNLTVNWRGQTNVDGLTYSLGLRAYNYQFEADSAGNADSDEVQFLFKAGLGYLF